MSENKRFLSGAVIAAMMQAGWLRSGGFRLFDGFNKELEIAQVKETKTRDAESNNNFRILGKIGDKSVSIPGSILANALLVPDEMATKLKDKTDKFYKDKSGVFNADDVVEFTAGAPVWNEAQGMNDQGYEFPEKVEIVGAIVNEDPDIDESPRMPLRNFKYYNTVRRFHLQETGDDEAFLTRDEFKEYITRTDNRPPGVPAEYTKLELLESIDKDDMRNWSFTLVVADVA